MVKFHRLSLLGAVVVVVATVTGCGGGSSGSGNEASSTTSGTSSSGGSVIKSVTIDESEFKLTPSSVTLDKPGTYEFKAVNKGSVTHALEVEGGGVEEKSTDIGPGESATIKVTFTGTGSFEMYCPVDGHKDQGMEGTITIGSSGAGSGGTTTDDNMRGDNTTTNDNSGGGGGY